VYQNVDVHLPDRPTEFKHVRGFPHTHVSNSWRGMCVHALLPGQQVVLCRSSGLRFRLTFPPERSSLEMSNEGGPPCDGS